MSIVEFRTLAEYATVANVNCPECYFTNIDVCTDGVYVSIVHKDKVTELQRYGRSCTLSDIYSQGGQQALDSAIMSMYLIGIGFYGDSKSVSRYKLVTESANCTVAVYLFNDPQYFIKSGSNSRIVKSVIPFVNDSESRAAYTVSNLCELLRVVDASTTDFVYVDDSVLNCIPESKRAYIKSAWFNDNFGYFIFLKDGYLFYDSIKSGLTLDNSICVETVSEIIERCNGILKLV